MLKTWGKAMVLKTFAANGKQYDIRLWFSRGEYVIRVFHGDHPANGYSYLIALNPYPDLKILAGQDMVKELTMVAKGAVSVKIVVAFSYAALADVDEVFASAGGFNQTSPI